MDGKSTNTLSSSDGEKTNNFVKMRTDNLLVKEKKSNKLFRRLRSQHTQHQCNLFPSTVLLMLIWLLVTRGACFAFIHSYMNWCQKASEAS